MQAVTHAHLAEALLPDDREPVVDLTPFEGRILAVPLIVTVEDEDLHRSHFVARATDSSARGFERYLAGFSNIRRVQKYIKSQALSHGVPTIPNYSLDQALTAVIDLVVQRATEALRCRRQAAPSPQSARREQTMKLFLDTAHLEEIREIKRWGVLGGCTTNPTLIAREHTDVERQMKEICAEVDGPVSLETTATDADDIYEEGLKLAQVGPNAVVKVVMTPDGLAAGKRLVDQGIPVNVTLTFSPAQAILAAEIGATYVSPFLGLIE